MAREFPLTRQAFIFVLEPLHHTQDILRQITLWVQFNGAARAVKRFLELEGPRINERQIGQRDHVGTIGLQRLLQQGATLCFIA